MTRTLSILSESRVGVGPKRVGQGRSQNALRPCLNTTPTRSDGATGSDRVGVANKSLTCARAYVRGSSGKARPSDPAVVSDPVIA